MTTPKLLTRDELLRLGGLVVNGDEDSLEAIGHICRHLAALLPADGALPPIDNADEQIVDALVAKAQEGRTSRLLTPRQVTQTIEDLRGAVRSQLQRERDAAPAMARLLCRFEDASGDGLYRLCCRSADKPHMPGCPLDACLTAIGISPEERERVRF